MIIKSTVEYVHIGVTHQESGLVYPEHSMNWQPNTPSAVNYGYTHDDDTYFRMGGDQPYFVKFGETMWEFYRYVGENSPGLRFIVGISYPIEELDAVIQPVPGYDLGSHSYANIIVGPVVIVDGVPMLLMLQLFAYGTSSVPVPPLSTITEGGGDVADSMVALASSSMIHIPQEVNENEPFNAVVHVGGEPSAPRIVTAVDIKATPGNDDEYEAMTTMAVTLKTATTIMGMWDGTDWNWDIQFYDGSIWSYDWRIWTGTEWVDTNNSF